MSVLRKLASSLFLLTVLEANAPAAEPEPPLASYAPSAAAQPSDGEASGGSPEERFARANADFAAGRYAEAIAAFEDLVATEGYSPALLFDLGNAYFRDGRLAEAILWYERARLLAPRDDDIAANLRQARRAANLPLPEQTGLARYAAQASADGWAILASVSLLLATLAALAGRLRRLTRGGAHRGLFLVAAGALLAAGGAALFCLLRLSELDRAVVTGSDPALLVAPYEQATVSGELVPGELVRIEQTHQGFSLVRTTAGRSGWIASDAVTPIVPPSDR